MIAILHGHSSIAGCLRDAGAQFSHKDSIDLGLRLCRSAAQGDLARVKSLIACKVPVNSCDYDQRTPLHLAAAHGHISVVEFLISSGIDIRKKDKLGRDAIEDADTAGHLSVKNALKRGMQAQIMEQTVCLNKDKFDSQQLPEHYATHKTFGPHLWLSRMHKPAPFFEISGTQPPTQEPSLSLTDHSSLVAAYLTSKAARVDRDVCWESHSARSTQPDTSISTSPLEDASALSHRANCQQDDYAFMSLADDFPDPISGCPWAYGEDGGEGEAGLGSLGTSAASVGTASVGSTGSLRLRNHAAPGATVLVIDIKGFTAGCAAMSAAEVGEWVAGFYQRVDSAAAAHGVRKAEVRGDCCICVAGTAAAVPWAELGPAARGPAPAADGRSDQVTRMLAFAADLCAKLATLSYPGGRATSARMGLATGDLSFLVGEGGGGGGFVSVQGDAVRVATRMEALSEPGTVLAHRSAIDKWVAEGAGAGGAPRDAPKTVQVDCGVGEAEAAAAYDCAARAFRRPAPGLPLSARPTAPWPTTSRPSLTTRHL